MNQGLQIRYALLQVQQLLQYNTDSKINKLVWKIHNCFIVLNVFRSCYLNRWVCNFFLLFFLAELDNSRNLLFCSGKISGTWYWGP